jgi:hypothetical protein
MPDVDLRLRRCYQDMLTDRLEAFPTNDMEILRVPSDKTAISNNFRHLLRYDAESTFWLLLWWCIQAQPEGDTSEIGHSYWSSLIDEVDIRGIIFIRSFPQSCLHSSYFELGPLLYDIGQHLQGDLEFSEDKEKKEPEYMHEAFQRLILNFLVTNEDKWFMGLEKDDTPRPVKGL